MKETIIICLMCSILVLGYAGSRPATKQTETVQCPNLEQLLAEKVAKEKQDRLDKAKERRDKIIEGLQTIDKIFSDP
jgi:hypothetical protein